MTEEAKKLLALVTRLAPVTHRRLTHQTNQAHRKLRLQVLAELLDLKLIYRDAVGFYRPAGPMQYSFKVV